MIRNNLTIASESRDRRTTALGFFAAAASLTMSGFAALTLIGVCACFSFLLIFFLIGHPVAFALSIIGIARATPSEVAFWVSLALVCGVVGQEIAR